MNILSLLKKIFIKAFKKEFNRISLCNSLFFWIFQYFGIKTFPVQGTKHCYLQKKICNYWGFYKGLSRYYMIFMNYITKLTSTRKSQFLGECSTKRRPYKTKILIWKFIPLPTLSCTIPKRSKSHKDPAALDGPQT